MGKIEKRKSGERIVPHAYPPAQTDKADLDVGHGMLEGILLHLKTKPPLAVFLFITILSMGLVLLFHSLAQKHFYFIYKMQFGYDYGIIYRASGEILTGINPYDTLQQKYAPYPFPPIPAILNIPLTYISHSLASVFISLLTFVSVVASIFLMHRVFTLSINRVENKAMLLLIVLIPMFSFPFHFLFDRGNLDGFVILLTSLGVYFLTKESKRQEILAGLFLAVAISFKVYPILMVLPLVAMRRWRNLVSLGGFLICLILIAPNLWMEWFEWTTSTRVSMFKTGANSSMANTLFHFGELFGLGWPLKAVAMPLWGLLLFAMFCFDAVKMPKSTVRKESVFAGLLFYIPFMVAVPELAYHYSLVCVLVLLPVLSYLWTNATRKERKILLFITVGLIMNQFQAFAFEQLLSGMSLPRWITGSCAERFSGVCFPQWIPGLGLFIVMTGCVIYKLRYLYKPVTADGSTKET
ncbi:MAG: glycosyltransferase family 87 protein [Candidatus Dadabacteria bacterium]|nr:glycosyltransferase family 87 protein [Candidatus Dadabacteria bacterium]